MFRQPIAQIEMVRMMTKQYKQVTEDNSKITIQDVAQALGISKTTVSRAISGKGRIGEETRNRVLEYIDKYGYKPNPIAKGLAQQRTYNIGWIMPGDSSISDLPFFQRCLRGVSEEAALSDYDVLLSMVYEDSIGGLERIVKGNKVDGVILGRTLVEDANVKYLKQSGIPFVVIGSTDEPDVVQIDNDHLNACRELTTALVEGGCNKLILIGGNDKHIVNRSRRKGYEEGVAADGGNEVSSEVYMNSDNSKAISDIVDDAIDKKIDCIVCMDDMICRLVLNELRNRDIKIPENMKVASFYNSEMLVNARPQITSLQYDPKELGVKACRILLDYIEGMKVPMKTYMKYEVLLKDSTSCK